MLLYGATSTRCSIKFPNETTTSLPTKTPKLSLAFASSKRLIGVVVVATAAAATALLVLSANAIEVAAPKQPDETLSNIPQTFSSECAQDQKDCNRRFKIQRPKSKKAETCTGKCVTTCVRGGLGASGEGPLNIRRPLVVFKDSFRSRKYCLSECSDICNLIGDGDDGP